MKILLVALLILVLCVVYWKFEPVKDTLESGVPVGVETTAMDEKVVVPTPETKQPGLAVKSTNEIGAGPSVLLAWDANSEPDLAYYRIYRATAQAGPFAQVWQGPETTWRDVNVALDATYYYRATASDTSANESAPSNVASATIPSPPAPPQNLSASPEWGIY